MLYALVDDFGRLLGTIDAPIGSKGTHIEYGGTRDGCLDVAGIGRIVCFSSLSMNDRIELTEMASYPHYDESGRKVREKEM